MPPIMKLISTFVFVSAAFVTGCSWGDGSGTDQPPLPQDSSTGNTCGDGVCAASEINLCAADCGTPAPDAPVTQCGNFVCDPGEDSSTCPNDCSGGGSGSGSGSGSGDITTCLLGCATQPDFEACAAACLGGGLGSGSGGFGDDTGCTGGAPDGNCDSTEMANALTCVSDCL
jgi:hypothetical protein